MSKIYEIFFRLAENIFGTIINKDFSDEPLLLENPFYEMAHFVMLADLSLYISVVLFF